MKRIAITLILVCLLTGCGPLRKSVIELSETDIKNAEALKAAARNHLSAWPVNSGFIHAALGSNIENLPIETVKAMAELDKLAEQDEYTDYELGSAMGYQVRILMDIVYQSLEKYAPDVLRYLPALI